MMIVYLDAILVVLKDTSTVINYFENIYVFKEGRMGPPNRYLGANTEKVHAANGSYI